jgi:predicted  nucleic acid-binding Zn-ribbon protein
VKSNTEYHALLHEIADMEKKIRDWEEKALEAMEAEEGAMRNLGRIEAELKGRGEAAEAEAQQLGREKEETGGRIAELSAERSDLLARLKPQIRSRYDRLLRAKGDTAIATSVGGTCEGCGFQLPPQTAADLRRSDRLVYCEGCGRFLVAPQTSEVS